MVAALGEIRLKVGSEVIELVKGLAMKLISLFVMVCLLCLLNLLATEDDTTHSAPQTSGDNT